jgi:hypothetical protein
MGVTWWLEGEGQGGVGTEGVDEGEGRGGVGTEGVDEGEGRGGVGTEGVDGGAKEKAKKEETAKNWE